MTNSEAPELISNMAKLKQLVSALQEHHLNGVGGVRCQEEIELGKQIIDIAQKLLAGKRALRIKLGEIKEILEKVPDDLRCTDLDDVEGNIHKAWNELRKLEASLLEEGEVQW